MVRLERLIIALLGLALLRAWWKLYKGKVKRWLKRTKDHLPLQWLLSPSVAVFHLMTPAYLNKNTPAENAGPEQSNPH